MLLRTDRHTPVLGPPAEDGYASMEDGGSGEQCGGFDSPFGGGSGEDMIGIDGGMGLASLAGGGIGAMGGGFGGSNAAVQCPDNACAGFGTNSNGQTEWVQFSAFEGGSQGDVSGYFYGPDLSNGIYVENGQLLDTTNHNNYLQNEYNQQVNNQCSRTSNNAAMDFGGSGAVSCGNPTIMGGHANFAFTCSDPSCGPGRYDSGIHVECASGGYSCNYYDPLVVHDDTISPWVGSFQFSDIFTGAFWEHGVADLIYGSACDCVLPH